MKGKAAWQCVTRRCGRRATVGRLCEQCANGEPPGSGAFIREPKPEEKPLIFVTGHMRRHDGRRERQLTDGTMRWWVRG